MKDGVFYFDPGVKPGVEQYWESLPRWLRVCQREDTPLASEWHPIAFREDELENPTGRWTAEGPLVSVLTKDFRG